MPHKPMSLTAGRVKTPKPRDLPKVDVKKAGDDRQYTDEEREFLIAIQRAKQIHGPYLTCQQVLQVAKELGYTKEK